MAANIDLKPLSDETIREMGYNGHDLWLVKIDSVVFGPFETQTLKHYVHDNEKLFETALASRADETVWKPFWEHTRFQRRKMQAVSEAHEGPFWILRQGMKTGPFTHREIDKKIEMDVLSMSDYVSVDNGENWLKIFQVADFDRRAFSPDELPIAPSEGSFKDSRNTVLTKLNQPHVNSADVAAQLAFEGREAAGKVIPVKLDEIPLKPQAHVVEVSSGMKWAMPSAAALLVTLATGSYLIWGPSDEVILTETGEEAASAQKKKRHFSGGGTIPSPSYRAPASVGYSNPDSSSRYPTYTETHDQFPETQDYHVDPVETLPAEGEQPGQEPSLVSQQGSPEENSLDAAMNGGEQPQPVVEESSDF